MGFFSIYKVLQTIALVIHALMDRKGFGPGSKLAKLKLINAAGVQFGKHENKGKWLKYVCVVLISKKNKIKIIIIINITSCRATLP